MKKLIVILIALSFIACSKKTQEPISLNYNQENTENNQLLKSIKGNWISIMEDPFTYPDQRIDHLIITDTEVSVVFHQELELTFKILKVTESYIYGKLIYNKLFNSDFIGTNFYLLYGLDNSQMKICYIPESNYPTPPTKERVKEVLKQPDLIPFVLNKNPLFGIWSQEDTIWAFYENEILYYSKRWGYMKFSNPVYEDNFIYAVLTETNNTNVSSLVGNLNYIFFKSESFSSHIEFQPGLFKTKEDALKMNMWFSKEDIQMIVNDDELPLYFRQ